MVNFFSGENFCDRFLFAYDIPLNNNQPSSPRCAISPEIESGIHPFKFRTHYGFSQSFNQGTFAHDLARDEPYSFRVIPSISKMSANQSTASGTVLTIEGLSLGGSIDDYQVSIADTTCTVTEVTMKKLECRMDTFTVPEATAFATT